MSKGLENELCKPEIRRPIPLQNLLCYILLRAARHALRTLLRADDPRYRNLFGGWGAEIFIVSFIFAFA